jgi:hypothetical protein
VDGLVRHDVQNTTSADPVHRRAWDVVRRGVRRGAGEVMTAVDSATKGSASTIAIVDPDQRVTPSRSVGRPQR